MNKEVRSNALAGLMNLLHTFNTGLVGEMASEATNCSPDSILNGGWVLVNYPPSVYGAVGSFLCAGWKFLTELAILQRKARDSDPFCTIWCDEAHAVANSYDAVSFIPQCRSHSAARLVIEPLFFGFLGWQLFQFYIDNDWRPTGLPYFFLMGLISLPFVELTNRMIWNRRLQAMADARKEQEFLMDDYKSRFGNGKG